MPTDRPGYSIAALAFVFLVIAAPDPTAADANVLSIEATGVDNVLHIDQPANRDNRIAITLRGERNGAGMAGWARPLPESFAAPRPGTLVQIGTGLEAVLDVTGRDNQFAVIQNGSANIVVGHMEGTGNIAAVRQTGAGHVASFRQIGSMNSVAISQSSW